MARIQKLSHSEIEERLASMEGWQIEDDKLSREFQFRDFVEAFGFMSQVALRAEALDHHPEWFNVYRTVRVQLTTHDCQGISERDFRLAKAIDQIAERVA